MSIRIEALKPGVEIFFIVVYSEIALVDGTPHPINPTKKFYDVSSLTLKDVHECNLGHCSKVMLSAALLDGSVSSWEEPLHHGYLEGYYLNRQYLKEFVKNVLNT